MKTQIKLMIVTILMMAPMTMLAQERGQGQRGDRGDRKERIVEALDLTDDQQSKIEAIRTAQMKESLQLRNQLNEHRAKLQTLRTSDETDLKAINRTIDEMTEVQASMMKSREASNQEVRALLNEEQKVKFDSMSGMLGKRRGHGKGVPRRGGGRGYGGQK